MSLLEGMVASADMRPAVHSLRSLARSALALGLSILVFFPLFPSMPSALLDPSWRMAFNEAWASGLNFARDMVFTYGPYAFVSTEQYQPDTYPVLVACTLFLGCVLFLLLRHIELGSKGRFRVSFVLLCLIASGYTSSPDVRFLCYAFLFLVAAATEPRNDVGGADPPALFSAPVVLNLAAFSLGMICLVKASYAVEIGAMGVLAMMALHTTGRRRLVRTILASFAFGLILFWLSAGQSLADLPRFFLNQAQVAAGYGQAMSSGDDPLPPALFLGSTIPLAIAIRYDLQRPSARKFALAIGMAVTLFFAFKEGFVREDDWHVMIAAEVLFILPWCWQSERADFWRKAHGAMAGMTVLAFTQMFPYALDLPTKGAEIEQLLQCSDRGLSFCPSRIGGLRKNYDLSIARIRAQVPVPKIQGTVDVYTVSQYLALANGYLWDPRPVGQSYSAYTPELARMNVEHLIGANAPAGALFALETIDGRLPTFADGPSWPILLTKYGINWVGVPAQGSGRAAIAYLKRKPDSSRITVTQSPLLELSAQLGSRIDLPHGKDVLYARIDVRRSAYGRFEAVLFRDSALYINFLFPGGRVESYRFIPGMARAGFIISPVVTNTLQFVAIRDLKVREDLSARRPVSFWLSGPPSARLMWADSADFHISQLQETHN